MCLHTIQNVTKTLFDEDTDASFKELSELFGVEIAQLIDGVTKLTNLELSSVQAKQAENFRKLLLAMSQDLRVLLVKLGDRLHNMRTIKHMRPDIIRRFINLRDQSEDLIPSIIKDVRTLLSSNNIEASITGREKKPYSIWRKMEEKQQSLI